MRLSLCVVPGILLGAAVASAKPPPLPKHEGKSARVAMKGGASEEAAAKALEKVIQSELGGAVTGLYVVDAATGAELFSTNADDRLNVASNVKMISTATALELLGPDFKYPTRVLGPAPDADGALHGDVYLLGSWDPTIAYADYDELGAQLAARGVKTLDGNVVIGADATRDGMFHAALGFEVKGGKVVGPTDVTVVDKTTSASYDIAKPKLTAKADVTHDGKTTAVTVTITGQVGKNGGKVDAQTEEHTLAAAFALRQAMRAHGITVGGAVVTEELGDFIGESVAKGGLPIELARHQSARLADIVAHVNKWSINWLADRVVISAAALHDRKPATMESGVDAMYGWLARHAHAKKEDLVVDTGSGLSYNTQISPRELVRVVRSASGFEKGLDHALTDAWKASLSIGGKDGTLSYRFRTDDVRGRVVGKTGTLSTVIALSGILEVDPARPLVFSIVTNTKQALSPTQVRKTHERLVGEVCKYLAKTSKRSSVSGPRSSARTAEVPPEQPIPPPTSDDE